MDKSIGQQRYSQKAKTLEAPTTSVTMRRLLGASITVQILCGLSMLFIGIYALTLCSEKVGDFAGITPIMSGIYCILVSILAALVCNSWRIASVTVGVANFVLASAAVVYEAASRRCTQQGPITKFCEEMRKSLNGCRLLHPINEKETEIPVDENEALRIPLLILAVIAILGSITTIFFLFFTIKIGKPVYLALKRHKQSIVVGQAKNAEEANVNKLKNMEIVTARVQEEVFYERKKKERLLEYYTSKRKSQESPQAKQAANADAVMDGEGSKRGGGSMSIKVDKSSPTQSLKRRSLNVSISTVKIDSKMRKSQQQSHPAMGRNGKRQQQNSI